MECRMDNGAVPTSILQALADGSCKTIDDLNADLPLNRRQISDGACQLILRDLAERIEVGCYRLTKAGLQAASEGRAITSGPRRAHTGKPRRLSDTFRQRAWTAMRMSGAFTVGDLVMAAARGEADPENNANRYLQCLHRAGYVVELPTRQPGTRLTSNGFKRYRLIRDTGPSAPVWSGKRRALHDFNTGEDVPCRAPR